MHKDGKTTDNGRTRQKYCCPFRQPKTGVCPYNHKNWNNGKKNRGCTKYKTVPNDYRLSIDRSCLCFKRTYALRTECERYNSRFKASIYPVQFGVEGFDFKIQEIETWGTVVNFNSAGFGSNRGRGLFHYFWGRSKRVYSISVCWSKPVAFHVRHRRCCDIALAMEKDWLLWGTTVQEKVPS